MKSLSFFILLGTTIAIIAGAVFVVSPALAQTPAQPAVSAAPEVVAPVTGAAVDVSSAPAAAPQAAEAVAAQPFIVNISKDRTAIEQAPAAEAAAPESVESAATQANKLDKFVASVSNGKANQVTGLFVDNVMAYQVTGQPNGDLSYVSTDPTKITEFGLARQYGSEGLLAHNYLAGAYFFKLSKGDIITLVYGDGSTANFQIDEVRSFQALSPESTQSHFVDQETGKELSASGLFNQIYNSSHALVLQTCITKDGESSWGRLFVMASPVVAE